MPTVHLFVILLDKSYPCLHFFFFAGKPSRSRHFICGNQVIMFKSGDYLVLSESSKRHSKSFLLILVNIWLAATFEFSILLMK